MATDVDAESAATPATPRRGDAGAVVRRLTADGRLLPYLVAYFFFVVYTAFALIEHARMETHAYDLGIFEQAVRNYAHLRAPYSDIRGMNILGDHFHPVIALLAPFYRLFPDARTLLVAQSLLFAVSVVPVTRMAVRVFGNAAGASVGFAYGLSWGLQSAVDFDFHEIAFAVPLLAFGLECFLRGRYVGAFAWWLPMVLVKEDLGLTIAAAAVPLYVLGKRRLAVVHLAVGVAAFLVTVLVLMPLINGHGYEYWGTFSGHNKPSTHASVTEAAPLWNKVLLFPVTMLYPGAKLRTLVMLLLPTGFLALRSPIAAMLVPTLLWRFASDNPLYWRTDFHYSAVLMPILFAAFLDAVVRLRTRGPRLLRAYAAKASVIPIVAALCLTQNLPLYRLAHGNMWVIPDQAKAADRMLRLVPDGVRVTGSGRFVPHLTNRDIVTAYPDILPGPGYAVVDNWDYDWTETPAVVATFQTSGQWQLVAQDQGVFVFRRG